MPDFFHPQLLPATIGAVVGLPLVILACVWLFRRWTTLKPRTRWLLFAAIAVVEVGYWLNIYAWFVEPNQLVIRRVDIVSAEWSGPLTPKTRRRTTTARTGRNFGHIEADLLVAPVHRAG